MKKTSTIYAYAVAVLLAGLATGCTREEMGDIASETLPDVNPSGIMRIAATADSMAGGDTKVDISTSTGAFTWSESDVIAVYSTGTGYVKFTLDSGAGTASGTFAQEFSGTRSNFAVYPASIANSTYYTSSDFRINLPSSYEIDVTKSDWKTYYTTYSPLPMVASNPSSGALAFKHVGGVFRITLNSVPANTQKIVVKVDDSAYITGTFKVTDPGSASSSISNTDNTSGSNGHSVTFNLSSALASETSGIVLNVPVPNGTYTGLRVECQNSSGTYISAATFDNSRAVSRATGRKLALNCASGSRLENFTLTALTEVVGQTKSMTFTATDHSSSSVASQSGFAITPTSSNTGVATVSYADGDIKVVGVANGTATITAVASLGSDKITKTATVTVKTGSITITSDNSKASGAADVSANSSASGYRTSRTLTASLTNVPAADVTAWSWSSGSTSVATVSGATNTSGNATSSSVTVSGADTAGTSTITGTATLTGGKTFTQTFVVNNRTLTLTPAVGADVPANGSGTNTKSISASISNSGAASGNYSWTVSGSTGSSISGTTASGSLTAGSTAGVATVTCQVTTSGGAVLRYSTTVNVCTLTITGNDSVMSNGSYVDLTATIAGGSTSENFSWTKTDANSLISTLERQSQSTTNSVGRATANSSGNTGSATITASVTTTGGAALSASKSLSVINKATISSVSVAVSSSESIVYVNDGGKVQLTATPEYSGEGEQTATYSWEIVSGDNLTLTNATSATVTLKGGSTAGTTSIKCTVTAANSIESSVIYVAVAPRNNLVGGEFSLSSSQKVYFARGNLSWSGSAFSIASTQYYYNTTNNRETSSAMNVFPYWKRTTTTSMGTMSSSTNTDYSPSSTYTATLSSSQDWGYVLGTSNGTWRTPTGGSSGEWNYLLSSRTSASSKRGGATVASVAGLIILPDTFTMPSGMTFASGTGYTGTNRVYTAEQWKLMELGGAVFLPAAGYVYYNGSSWYTNDVGSNGLYWSSTGLNAGNAYHLSFGSSGIGPANYYDRRSGLSVRLVQNK